MLTNTVGNSTIDIAEDETIWYYRRRPYLNYKQQIDKAKGKGINLIYDKDFLKLL